MLNLAVSAAIATLLVQALNVRALRALVGFLILLVATTFLIWAENTPCGKDTALQRRACEYIEETPSKFPPRAKKEPTGSFLCAGSRVPAREVF